MVDRKVTVKVPMPDGRSVEKTGIDVGIVKSDEKWSEVELQDGTTLRLRPNVVQVIRVDGEFDNDGNPAYITRVGNVVVVSSPPELKKKG